MDLVDLFNAAELPVCERDVDFFKYNIFTDKYSCNFIRISDITREKYLENVDRKTSLWLMRNIYLVDTSVLGYVCDCVGAVDKNGWKMWVMMWLLNEIYEKYEKIYVILNVSGKMLLPSYYKIVWDNNVKKRVALRPYSDGGMCWVDVVGSDVECINLVVVLMYYVDNILSIKLSNSVYCKNTIEVRCMDSGCVQVKDYVDYIGGEKYKFTLKTMGELKDENADEKI